MSTTEAINPSVLDNTALIDAIRSHWEVKHAQIVTEARAVQRKIVRDEFCNAFNVGCVELKDDDYDGGGSITLTFPPDWTEPQAETFATDCLDLDLSERSSGPGRYFQNGGIGRHVDTGEIYISMCWGLDI